jgi:hypothetical protein
MNRRFSTRWIAGPAALTTAIGLCGASLLQASRPAQQAATQALPDRIEFNRDIRPILSDKCFQCHGPGTQMATLRFDLEDGARHELRGGRFAIVPGDPDRSVIIQRVTAANPLLRMPRSQGGKAAGQPLTDREVSLLRRWIDQGATWQKHWSFIPPVRPAVPTVADREWVRNPIDAFVLSRLEREGLKPSPEAEPSTLLRRVTLDLTGLPPTPAELDAFLADKSANAYEKVVDRLLRSPRYGERMAFPWLDAARYADSNGYQVDGHRHMWRWRDWVIDAFNRNLPFDRFAIEQLAGDLLPNATLNQQIATGFNRNHRGNAEGGIIADEYAVEYVVDRVDTTATVFLGLTFGCARCHSHKFDPLTQKEFYQLYAYFNNVPEQGRARRVGNSPPYVVAPLPAQQDQLKQLDARLAAAENAFARLQPELARTQKAWERTLNGSSAAATWVTSQGLVAHFPLDGDVKAPVFVPPAPEKRPAALADPALVAPPPPPPTAPAAPAKPPPPDPGLNKVRFVPGRLGQAATFGGGGFVQGGDLTGFASHMEERTVAYDDAYTIAAWIYPTAATGAIVTKVEDDVSKIDDLAPAPIGHGLSLRDGKIHYNNSSDIDEAIRLLTERTVSLNQWHHVAVTYDGSRWASGVKVYVDGESWKLQVLLDDLNNPAPAGARREPVRIGAGGGPRNRFQGHIDDVRVYNRALSAAEAGVLSDLSTIGAIAAISGERRTATQADKIREYFLADAAPANIRNARKELIEARERRDAFYHTLPTVMVMEEMSKPRASHLLIRGAYDRPGDPVTPALPAALAGPETKFQPNRLGLARWLVDPANPLTARVTVNRFWQLLFGVGLVKTSEDFGSQGEAPSHPELLDWLATEFVQTGWDVKGLQKTILMSATYRQASRTPAELLAADPDNRLLARGPNVRLSADIIRDQALAIAGLLTDKIGGPSVKSYQPVGLWNEVGGGATYVQDHGADLYRRSLYLFWKRTVPPPAMANFDASSRESHVVKPVVTNTPLQALNLMNDVTFLEAARVFAQRVMKEGGTDPLARIRYAFRMGTSRLPKPEETAILADAFKHNLEVFAKKPDEARQYVSYGEYPLDPKLSVSELAAYTTVTSLILNLSETVMKE